MPTLFHAESHAHKPLMRGEAPVNSAMRRAEKMPRVVAPFVVARASVAERRTTSYAGSRRRHRRAFDAARRLRRCRRFACRSAKIRALSVHSALCREYKPAFELFAVYDTRERASARCAILPPLSLMPFLIFTDYCQRLAIDCRDAFHYCRREIAQLLRATLRDAIIFAAAYAAGVTPLSAGCHFRQMRPPAPLMTLKRCRAADCQRCRLRYAIAADYLMPGDVSKSCHAAADASAAAAAEHFRH